MKASALLPFVLLMSGAAPALADPAPKTELLDSGKAVADLQLRYDFNGAWVVDTRNVMWRDTSDNHYLVTLADACNQLVQWRPFNFRPADAPYLLASRSYEVRPFAGKECRVARIERLNEARGLALRENALRRAW